MALDIASVDAFAASFAGTLFRPSDPGFAAARAAAAWNGDVVRQPGLIVQPTSAAQVAETLAFARSCGAAISVRGGGHGFSGRLVADGAVMIDLSRINVVRVDADNRRAYVGGGASWAPVDAATAEHGLAVVGGTISHTGVAGLTLSGGMGWLTRSQGLSCDNLLEATVVTADGRTVIASEDENPDLLWGLRGAGANFGVVTELVFQLHAVNPLANLGMFFWRAEDAAGPLQFIRDYNRELPEGTALLLAGLSAPPAPFVPETAQGLPGWVAVLVSWGSPAEHAAAVAPLREQGPLWELVTPMPYAAIQQMLDDSAPWGCLAYEKGIYLPELTDPVIGILVDRLPRKRSPLTFSPIFPLDGAFCDVADGATAFGGRRQRQWAMSAAAMAFDQETLAADRAWARDFYAAVREHTPDDGSYVNFSSEPEDARIRAAYGEQKYARLQALKAIWDPQNVFRNNANIPPASPGLPGPRTAEPAAEEQPA
jgi:FAD/FMN-containing dehydrogenase